jgi:hypothetical protein
VSVDVRILWIQKKVASNLVNPKKKKWPGKEMKK